MTTSRLSEPVRIGSLTVPNRLVVAPLITNLAHPDGSVTDTQVAYYAARGGGGWGAVWTEGATTSPEGRGFAMHLAAHTDAAIPGLARIARAIRAGGPRAILQVMHSGRQTTRQFCGGQPVAPSPVPHPRFGEVPRPLGEDELPRIVEDFAQAVRRGREAGFDGAEIHGAHGYLIASFLSPLSNRRTDAYGGDVRGRARLLVEILRRCREVVGSFPLSVRLSVEEYTDSGVGLAEGCEIARLAVAAGADAIHASAGIVGYGWHPSPPGGSGWLSYAHLAAAVKATVSVPVIAVGRVTTPERAEELLVEGLADLVAIGRSSIADPAFAAKALNVRRDPIIPCVGCNVCNARSKRPEICCLMNPATGRESHWRVRPPGRVRRLVVVGSGVGGLAAAVAARERGLRAEVQEPGETFGGLLALRARTPLQRELETALAYWRDRLSGLAIPVHYRSGQPGSRDGTEAVVVAVGADPAPPDLPAPVPAPLISALDVLRGRAAVAGPVVVLGGSLMGAEVACVLADAGRAVAVVEAGGRLAYDAAPAFSVLLLHAFQERKIRLELSARPVAGSRAGELAVETATGLHRLPCATIVYAGESDVDGAVLGGLAAGGLPVFPLGDAYDPAGAADLAWRGARYAMTI